MFIITILNVQLISLRNYLSLCPGLLFFSYIVNVSLHNDVIVSLFSNISFTFLKYLFHCFIRFFTITCSLFIERFYFWLILLFFLLNMIPCQFVFQIKQMPFNLKLPAVVLPSEFQVECTTIWSDH